MAGERIYRVVQVYGDPARIGVIRHYSTLRHALAAREELREANPESLYTLETRTEHGWVAELARPS